MTIKMLINLNFLELEDNSQTEVSDFLFSNNQEIRKHIYIPQIIEIVGTVDSQYSKRDGFIYYDKPINLKGLSKNAFIDRDDISSVRNKTIHLNMDCVSELLLFLWMVKDNSIGIADAVCMQPEFQLFSKASAYSFFSNAKGGKEYVIYSDSEIKLAHELWIKYKKLINKPSSYDKNRNTYFKNEKDLIDRSVVSAERTDFDYNKTTCIERAMHFLETARKQEYLIYKIAFYMSAFECLFTTDSADVTNKLRYRVAFYLGETKDECIDIDNTIKLAYAVRSKFMHGQVWGKESAKKVNQDSLLKYSVSLDDYLRRTLTKIINYDSNDFINLETSEKDSKFHRWAYEKSYLLPPDE